jgi:hypothetical protein
MSGEATKETIMAARLSPSAVPLVRPAKGEGRGSGIRRSEDTPERGIPESEDSPFTVLSTGRSEGVTSHRGRWVGPKEWSDAILKRQASMSDRVVLAIRDAAHCASGKGVDPTVTPIYITSVIRKGWGLSPKELSKQLIRLEASGIIVRFGAKVKGKHSRFILAAAGGF